MELSLQSNKDYKSMLRKRQMMITKEKLHINDKIDYNKFLELYKKYGNDIDEKDFAKYILDISYNKHYYLQCGKTKVTPILLREYISQNELERIRKQVEEIIKEIDVKQVNYDLIRYLYENYGGKLDIATFGEEILGITSHSIECLKSEPKNRQATLYSISYTDRIETRRRQNEIILAEKLHIDDTITLEQFNELYKKYGKGISEKNFAIKVLQIPQSRYNRFKSGKNAYTTILSRYIYNPESVFKLRESVIKKERLHIDDLINYQKFQELHKKYGGPLSEEMFAEEVLDITTVGVKNMRVDGTNSAILINIDIPEEYVLELRKIIVSENGLGKQQMVSMEMIENLYKKYGGVLSQRQFATIILDINKLSYNSLASGANKTVTILQGYDVDRFPSLRRRIIYENNLHYDEEINYQTFQRIYKQYAGNEKDTVFAEKVFDLPPRIFWNLKYGSTKKVNILKNEPLPTDESFEDLKMFIALEFGLHIKDQINYATFKRIYDKYAGIVSEELFAKKIFDMSKSCLLKIKNDSKSKTTILAQTKMSETEIEKLRKQVMLDNSVYPGKPISFREFKKMYKSYGHILSERLFSELILGIEAQCLNKLKNHSCKTIEAFRNLNKDDISRTTYFTDKEVNALREFLIQGLSEEEIATKLFVSMPFLKKNMAILYRYERLSPVEIEAERIRRGIDSTKIKISKGSKIGSTKKQEEKSSQQRAREGEVLRKKKTKIIDDFEFSENDIKNVRAYIENCAERFKYGEFPQIEIPDLEESITFIEPVAKEINFFSKVCISFGLYKKANVFISNNIDNPGITDEEKIKLKRFQESIKYAIKKVNAVNMIVEGNKDTNVISKQTGVSEIDVIEMQKRLNQGKKITLDDLFQRSLDEEI